MSAVKSQVKTEKSVPAKTKPAEVLFAPAAIERLEASASLPAKFQRMLDQLPVKRVCEGAVVAVKIHVGVGLGFTTIPPLFLRMVIQKIKDAGAKSVFVTDGSLSIAEATARGYTAEVLGVPLLGAGGFRDKFFYKHKVGYETLGSRGLWQYRRCRCPDQHQPLQGPRRLWLWWRLQEPGDGVCHPALPRPSAPVGGWLGVRQNPMHQMQEVR
jgi:hypothetical protein